MSVCAQSAWSLDLIQLTLLTPAGQRPAAIVSPYAGTTRDVLESALDIFGYPIVLRSIFIAYLITTHFNVTFGLYDTHDQCSGLAIVYCMLSDSVKQGYACIFKRNAVKI